MEIMQGKHYSSSCLEAKYIILDACMTKPERGKCGSRCHGHTNRGLGRSTDEEVTIDKATDVEVDVTRLGTLEAESDETMNLERMKKNMKIKETIQHEMRILD